MEDKKPPSMPQATAVLAQQTQLLYADKVIGINLGVHVSRIIFGMEVTPTHSTPTIAVGLPTNALIQFCRNFLAQVKDNEGQIETALENYKNILSEVRQIDVGNLNTK